MLFKLTQATNDKGELLISPSLPLLLVPAAIPGEQEQRYPGRWRAGRRGGKAVEKLIRE
jgi:hypothetical protein